MSTAPPSRIYTIGHGNAPFTEIEDILERHGIATLVDVRATPYSKYAPDFRKDALEEMTAAAGFGYRWMGDRLGGRPAGREADVEEAGSQPDGGNRSTVFRGAIDEVVALNATGPVALLCAERDPEHCHRRLVLAPVLEACGLEVFHILADGAEHRHQPTLGI